MLCFWWLEGSRRETGARPLLRLCLTMLQACYCPSVILSLCPILTYAAFGSASPPAPLSRYRKPAKAQCRNLPALPSRLIPQASHRTMFTPPPPPPPIARCGHLMLPPPPFLAPTTGPPPPDVPPSYYPASSSSPAAAQCSPLLRSLPPTAGLPPTELTPATCCPLLPSCLFPETCGTRCRPPPPSAPPICYCRPAAA